MLNALYDSILRVGKLLKLLLILEIINQSNFYLLDLQSLDVFIVVGQ